MGVAAQAAAGADYFNTYVMTSYREYYRSATVYAAAFDDSDRIELQFLNSAGRVEVTTRGVTAGTYPGTPEILAAVEARGETLARVARRYDVSRSQIYTWRHQFKKSGRLPAPVGSTFLQVDIDAPMLNAKPAPPPAREALTASPSIVELGLAQGRCLRFDSGIESTVLIRLIRSVEAA